MDTTTKQVRQVLMNELGFTRESIKEVMKEVAQEVVDKHSAALIEQRMESMLLTAIASYAKNKGYSRTNIETMIHQALDKAVAKAIEEQLTITFKRRGDTL